MEEAEQRMAALKKAYAEIILNTAKESAARILASESKAIRFQQSLAAAKEEALQTILRLKGIMDAKITEADKASLDQKRRIQELESQLNQADYTINSLRTELKRVNEVMEKMKCNPTEGLDRQTMKGQGHEDAFEENEMVSDSMPSSPVDGTDGVLSDVKNSSNNSHTSNGHCYIISEKPLQKSLQDSSPEIACSENPDLASLIMRTKEPELYRNGCTQRIRALEHIATGKMPRGETDGHFSKSASAVYKNGIAPNPCLADCSMGENNTVDHSNESNEMPLRNDIHGNGQAANFSKLSLRKRRSRPARATPLGTCSKEVTNHGSSKILGIVDEGSVNDVHALSTLRPCQSAPPNQFALEEKFSNMEIKSNGTHLSMENIENKEINKAPESPIEGEKERAIPTGGGAQNPEAQGLLCKGEHMPLNSGQNTTEVSDISNCKVNLETSNALLVHSDMKGGKSCELNGAPTKATGSRLLKYTFQRKRMRGSSSGTRENVPSEEKSTLKRKACDETSALPEPTEPSLVKESSRESRRIAQVARQLISLSEKRW